MHPLTIIIISAAAGFVLADIVLNVIVIFSCRRQIKWLKESNELLTQKNLALGISCTDQARELKHLRNERNEATAALAAKDKQITELTNQLVKATDDRDRTVGVINNLSRENRENRAKLKSAHDHISVLRVEIIKLNRQLNQTKRRG